MSELASPAASTTDNNSGQPTLAWQNTIPWFATIAATITLIAIAWFLVENVWWFRHSAIDASSAAQPIYRLHVYHLHIAMIKRSVGLFSGFALLFLGVAVVFYTLRTSNQIAVSGPALSASVASASPGLIAMALGVLLLISTIASKDEFPNYRGEASTIATDTAEIPFVPFQPEGERQ